MRNPSPLFGLALVVAMALPSPAGAGEESANLFYEFTLSLEQTRLDHLSLGNDPARERLLAEDYEFELDLEYSLGDRAYLFFTASLIDQAETVKPLQLRESVSGVERKQMGVAVGLGDEVYTELKLGRREFYDASEWWVWWDEELDAVSLESHYRQLSGMLAVAQEQARDSTAVDFIDPEQDGVRRVLANLRWDLADSQALMFYFLEQKDRSSSYRLEDIEELERIDDADADLGWRGVSYLGEFELEALGEIDVELHYSRVSGDETRYQFEQTEGAVAEVGEIETVKVDGSARGFRLGWRPPALDRWTFIVGAARGSGDANPNDSRDGSYRQTGLQGDSEIYGELYRPELSNLAINTLGLAWKLYPGIEIALLGYDYQQRHASDEIRDVSIELDPNGVDRDLGREIDLALTIDAVDSLELIVIAAEFEAGAAYGERAGERSRFLSLQLDYRF